MPTYAKQVLSGSTNGRVIPVAATATPGTLIHTALGGATGFDELHLWATNVTAGAVALTIEWGGVTDPGDHLLKAYSIPANSKVRIAEGQVLQNGLVVRAFAASASAINISGYANRIS